MRRAICNLPTKDYNNIFRDVLIAVARTPHAADEVVVATLGAQSGINRRWPDDDEFHAALTESSLYDRLVRARIRILLEGIEDHLRATGYTEHLVVPTPSQANSKLTIEHVMPQSWEEHWPIGDTSAQAADRRDELVHFLGNLTLATAKLNPALGNADWATKKTWLTSHSLLLITTTTILTPPPGVAAADWPDGWHEDCIEARGEYLAQQAIAAWPHQ